MRPLTHRELRTVRLGLAVLILYLGLFYGLSGFKQLENRRVEYERLLAAARQVRQEARAFENKALLLEKLKTQSGLDPSTLSKTALVGEVSAAIQKTAQTGGVQLGPIRESPGSVSARELGSMQLEATGPGPFVVLLCDRLQKLGYPLLLESIQLSSDPSKPGAVKLTMQVTVLDFDQWKGS